MKRTHEERDYSDEDEDEDGMPFGGDSSSSDENVEGGCVNEEAVFKRLMKEQLQQVQTEDRQYAMQDARKQQLGMQQQRLPQPQQRSCGQTTVTSTSQQVVQAPAGVRATSVPTTVTHHAVNNVIDAADVNVLNSVFVNSKGRQVSMLYVIVFYKVSCAACVNYRQRFAQFYHEHHPGVAFVYVNAENPAFAPYVKQMGIRMTPTFVFMKACNVIAKVEGFNQQEKQVIDTYLFKLKL